MGLGETATATAGFRDALGHRELRWLAAHHLVAGSGQSFGTVAVATALYAQTGSASWVAAAAACRLVPYLVCAAPAGALADRTDRRRLLLGSALLRAVVATGLALAVALDAAPIAIVALVFVGTAMGTGCYPALLAVIPASVPEHHLPPATAIVNTIETSAWLVGPALGGLLLLGGSPEIALAANVALFLAGAALLAPVGAKPAPGASTPDASSIASRLVLVTRTITRTPAVGSPLVLVVAANLALGTTPILLLLLGQEQGLAGSHRYELMSAALGVGGFCGVVLTNRVAARPNTIAALSWSVALGTVPLVGLLATDHLAVAMALVALVGAGMVVTEVVALSVMLRSLPDTVVGGVFGLVDSCLVAAVLVGSLLAAPLADRLGLAVAIAAVALGVPTLAVAAARWNGRTRRPVLPPAGCPEQCSSAA